MTDHSLISAFRRVLRALCSSHVIKGVDYSIHFSVVSQQTVYKVMTLGGGGRKESIKQNQYGVDLDEKTLGVIPTPI